MTEADLAYYYIPEIALTFVLVFFSIRFYIRLKFGSFRELKTLIEKYFETKEIAEQALKKEKQMKFRKKPVVIEAKQFWVFDIDGWPHGVYEDNTSPTGYRIDTLEGSHEVTEGDWIITGIKGERYPCKRDIFEMTYEKVE